MKLPTGAFVVLKFAAIAAAAAVALAATRPGDWDLGLFAALTVFAAIGDLTAPRGSKAIKVSGSFLALVMSMVFLGPAPAVLIGVTTILVGWLRWRYPPSDLLHNVFAYSWFPLLGALTFNLGAKLLAVQPDEWGFYGLIAVVFVVANAANIALVGPGLDREKWADFYRSVLVPGLPSQFAAALLAIGVAFLYIQIGLGAIGLLGVVFLTFQYLVGRLLVSEERRDELERRSNQLASLQVGMLSALLRTLDLRDRMTARHSAAVARYSREIAAAAGLSEEEQELVHTAGLLHDIGKFIFPDHILKADVALGDEDWNIIRTHPYQGARIVSQVDGYGPVGEIVLAHHERIDGKGYPRGLAGDEIPMLSRIISVADVYDVITARDSYREPVSSFEAIQELRRVAGTQLDPHFVNVFVELLAGRDVRYRHGEDADFESELNLEKRVHAYAAPREGEGLLAPEARQQDADGGVPQTASGTERPAREISGA